jgi:hypothetical protein
MPKTNKTIVLDLDSTLLHTCDDMEIWDKLEIYTNPKNAKLRSRVYFFELIDVTEKVGSGSKTILWGVLRPHVYTFLRFCFDYFENVIVWSAGQKKYVHAICDFLFQEFEKQPTIIFTYEDCEIGSNYIHKPLVKFPQIPVHTIVTLDDNVTTFSKNKGNGLLIPPYEPEFNYNGIMEDERSLLNVMYWLTSPEVMNASDIRVPSKSTCFEDPPEKYETMNDFLAVVGMIPDREVTEEFDIFQEEDNEIKHLSPSKRR